MTVRDTECTFSAPDAAGVVEAMRASSWTGQGETVAQFMAAVAARVRLWNGAAVRTESPEAFLADLEAAGCIQRETPT